MDNEKCERWFNLGEGELHLSSLPAQLPEGLSHRQSDGCFAWADDHSHMWTLLKDGLRRKYFSPSALPKSPTPQYKPDSINVGVHIRRGDILHSCAMESDPLRAHMFQDLTKSRCMPPKLVAHIVQQVADRLANITSLPINIQVFTEGEHPKELPEILKITPKVQINFGGDALIVSHALITSDVLIMAHSSFSLIAAIYGAPEQLVIYDEFWSKSMPNWVPVNNGTIGGGSWIWHQNYMFERVVKLAEARSSTFIS